jgi:hypothetical protein
MAGARALASRNHTDDAQRWLQSEETMTHISIGSGGGGGFGGARARLRPKRSSALPLKENGPKQVAQGCSRKTSRDRCGS